MKSKIEKQKLQAAIDFTLEYKLWQTHHFAVREAMCLKAQAYSSFQPIGNKDLIAGRILKPLAGIGSQTLGYYCNEREILSKMKLFSADAAFCKELRKVIDFWKNENTAEKVRKSYPDLHGAIPANLDPALSHAVFPLFRMGVMHLNYDLLCKQGIPGLRKIVTARKNNCKDDDEIELFHAFEIALDIIVELCLKYADEAFVRAGNCKCSSRKEELLSLHHALKSISRQAPKTFQEAIQLFWLFSQLADNENYGRMDVYLGDFYASEKEAGTLSEEKALKLLCNLWQIMNDQISPFNCRVIIGGKGRRNENNADQFALLAIKATCASMLPLPQLSLRTHKDQNPLLLKKSLEVLGEGAVHPILYNDEVNVHSLVANMKVSVKEAEQYVPGGCGEFTLDHRSVNSPNSTINILKILNITLRNGIDPYSGRKIGMETGSVKTMKTFDDLLSAYKNQITYFVDLITKHSAREYLVAGQEYASLHQSMLYDSCLDKGKAIISGGCEYLGCVIETYGCINAGDSLRAIKKVVFDEKKYSLKKLIQMLDDNFEGWEKERLILENIPKYGNDDSEADEMVCRLHNSICLIMQSMTSKYKLDYCLMDLINVSFATVFGETTSASADGRKKGMPMANANTPSLGQDKNGITACFNSLLKLDSKLHLTAVQNIKLEKAMFKENLNKIEALLNGYFSKGGAQIMITAVDKGELEDAIVNPNKHRSLMVRIGGYTGRFVDLPENLQSEVLGRRLY